MFASRVLSDIGSIAHCPTISSVSIDGERHLELSDILAVACARADVQVVPSAEASSRSKRTLAALAAQLKSGVPIYGVSSAFGGQAGRVLNQGGALQLWRNACALSDAIVHVDVSTGEPLPVDLVRAAILIRLNTLSAGYSGIRPSTLALLATLLNANVTPVVGRYGSLGASGDLAQNGRLVSVLQHWPQARVYDASGAIRPAAEVLSAMQLPPLQLDPKEGLALVNGDNYSSAAALCLARTVAKSLIRQLQISAIIVQVLLGSTRNFHPLLEILRPHAGQAAVAYSLRHLLEGSHLAPQELTSGHLPKVQGKSIQDPYSIRCLPQFLGVDVELIHRAIEVLAINVNGVSDNPLWTDEATICEGETPYQWVSGGNFLAMHMAEILDALRKTMVRLIKLNDRHVSRLVHTTLNNGLPANLSPNGSLSHCTFKGLQTQMGMFDVYASALAVPITTGFGTHEELNQDLTSHALSSYIIGAELVKVLNLAQASALIAAGQAVELRGGDKALSPATRPMYAWLRGHLEFVSADRPLGADIEHIASQLDLAPLFTEGYDDDKWLSELSESAQ